jgi:hypothetical protein
MARFLLQMHNGAEGLHFSVHYSVSVPPLLLSLHPLSPRENEKVKAIGEKTSTAFRKTGTAIRERASTLRVSPPQLFSGHRWRVS